ncbi:UNVERIFIED_CONTAM: hypothetical protein HDU68_004660 [Siphonaria sp. JEL0065]|nr:hypothetical protein HDU68_004660 [Siphonaria sp. JEL0065]
MTIQTRFIKQFLGGPGDVDVEALKHENDELKKRVEELQARIDELTNPASGQTDGAPEGVPV